MASNALECDVCTNVFSQEHLPRILPCSHTFCGPCIDGIIATQKKTCPNCREEFTAASAEDFMINRIALDAAKQFGPETVKPQTLSSGATGLYLKFTKDFLESDLQILMSTEILKEMKDVWGAIKFLKEMKGGILGTNKEIEASVEKMNDIKFSNENIVDEIDKKIKWLRNKMILILHEEGKTQDAEAELESEIDSTSSESDIDSTSSESEIDSTLSGPVMAEAEEVLQEGQEKVKKIQELLKDHQRQKDDIVKDIVTMRKQLGKVAEEIDTLKISAVKVIEGKQMVAPVRVKPGNQVQLSHFAEGDVPPKSLIIKHEALMETSSRRAFLDLAVEGTKLGRLVIQVMDEGNLALHFLHLCAGDLGPSYADSHLSRVGLKGQDGERIWVNGYKTSGGITTTAIMKQIDWNKEEQREIYKLTTCKTGEVKGYLSEGRASEFYIVTRDGPYMVYNNYCFGIVEEGLDVLRDAILRYPDIRAVRIVDCGLLLST